MNETNFVLTNTNVSFVFGIDRRLRVRTIDLSTLL